MKKIAFGIGLIAAVVLSGCVSYTESYPNDCEKDSDCVLVSFGDLSKPGSISGQTCANANKYQQYFEDAEIITDSDSTCVCGEPAILGKRLCVEKAAQWTQCSADSGCKKITWWYDWSPEGALTVCTTDPIKYLEKGFGSNLESIEYEIGDSQGCICRSSKINNWCELKQD